MNDISVKIVESPKEQAVSPSTLAGAETEFDPLAIDELDVKERLVEETPVEKAAEVKVESDDNAKETIVSESQNEESQHVIPAQTESKEELKEDTSPVNTAESEDVDPQTEPEPTEQVDIPSETAAEPQEVSSEVLEPSEPIKPIKIEKEPSPQKEIVSEDTKIPEPDVEMTEVIKVEEKIEPKLENKVKPMNGDVNKEDQGTKRRSSQEVETESPLKKLCQEIEKNFPQHDAMVTDYIHTTTKNNVDEIQRHTEQLLAEIQTLRELAQKKEHEWNNILHLKKVKEEILLRLLRRKQVYAFEKSTEVNGQDPFDYLNQAKNLAIDKSDEISGLSLKQPGSTMNPMMTPVMPVNSPFNPMAGLPPPYDKAHLQNMPKPVFPQQLMMPGPLPGFPRDMNGQLSTSYGLPMGRQGPTKDVKSIIADYRQRNPEVTPRRGRRMKSILNPNMMVNPRPIAPKVDGMANLNNLNNLNMIFNNLDMNQKAMLERLQQIQAGGLQNGLSFKDVLVQFANMQQNNPGLIPPNRPMEPMPCRPEHHVRPDSRRRQERHEEPHKPAERHASPGPRLPPPPPYPEISLLPVSTAQETSQTQQQNSLLHGILTKNCGEITITPVQPTPPPPEPQPEKTEDVVQLDSSPSGASEPSAAGSPAGGGRLVIDEGAEEAGAGAGEADADAPLCQGCRRRDAQFVCAGCANQWYCSRDCQVAAWDEHSEMCSG